MKTKLLRIERGIKMPPVEVNRKPTRPSAVALTLAKLEKGDSFLVANEFDALKAAKVLRDFAARVRTRKSPHRFIARKVGKGKRIWRVL